jgi:hypothetical protein
MFKTLFATAALVVCATAASAVAVHPTSYTMPNGTNASFTYYDDTYNTPGAQTTTSFATLSGGLGDLTDGVIATQNWDAAGQTSSTPYVAWNINDPRITFYFGAVRDFNSATFHFSGSSGGVIPPDRVTANGVTQSVPTQPNAAPFAFTMSLGALSPTDALTFDVFRDGDNWVFISEVTFDAAPVPLPASGLLLIGAVGGLAAWRRKRS